MSRKIYRITRTTSIYVEADDVEDAKDAVESEDTIFEESIDGDPVEVPYIDTGFGKLYPTDDEEDTKE